MNKYLHKVNLIPEIARRAISKGLPLNEDATVDSYLYYILAQLKAEREATARHVISDRSLVDLLAYIRANANSQIPDSFVNMVEELLWLETRYFDAYCYIPIEFPLVIDAVRSEQEAYQTAVDTKLVGILSEYGVRVKMITGSIEERCETVLGLFPPTRG
jgi:hypothetical protein